jgi:hypothetical protein
MSLFWGETVENWAHASCSRENFPKQKEKKMDRACCTAKSCNKKFLNTSGEVKLTSDNLFFVAVIVIWRWLDHGYRCYQLNLHNYSSLHCKLPWWTHLKKFEPSSARDRPRNHYFASATKWLAQAILPDAIKTGVGRLATESQGIHLIMRSISL